MTESEAIKICNTIGFAASFSNPKWISLNTTKAELAEAMRMSIQALEKQIPKKVKKEQWIDSKCTCGYVFSKHHGDGYYSIPLENKTKYCPNCGQKIDFGE